MIEDVLNLTTDIVNNSSDNFTKVEQFVLHTVKDNGVSFVQIDGMNRSHTGIFKIRAKQSDLGLIFKYPCIYEYGDALLRKWRLRRITCDVQDEFHWNNLRLFNDVFDIEYDKFDCADLKKLLLNWDCEQIEIRNNNCYNVYSSELLRRMVIGYDLEDIGLKLMGPDTPLRLNYKYGIFDVYCLIAPRIEVEEKIFYLRV